MMRAVGQNEKVMIRNPHAIRPWQHVLEPLSGYLLLGQKLLEGRKEFAEAWNFGPSEDGNVTVGEIAAQVKKTWPKIDYEIQKSPDQPHEAGMLRLDCSKARTKLKWAPVWDGKIAIKKTTQWYKTFYKSNECAKPGEPPRATAQTQKANIFLGRNHDSLSKHRYSEPMSLNLNHSGMNEGSLHAPSAKKNLQQSDFINRLFRSTIL